jgi:aspartyl-tRNA(Asn)/glutamyl-tRNA(Gln) amidotransferase subunit C
MPSLPRDEVAALARLARIDLSDDELDALGGQLGDVLGWVARISEAGVGELPPTSHAVPLTNVFREDVPRPSLGAQAALSGAPAVEEQRFRVPRILEEEL